ncbi:MAG: DamX protein [Flavobacterium sp.]
MEQVPNPDIVMLPSALSEKVDVAKAELELAEIQPAITQEKIMPRRDPIQSNSIVESQQAPALVGQNSFVFPIPEKALVTNKWIMDAALTDYTLQVMGSSNENRIREFISAQEGGNAFTYYETTRQDQSWFVLTVGRYQNRDEALAAIDNLPPNIQSQLPWARNVASIQSALTSSR